jgi:hypothetical protein
MVAFHFLLLLASCGIKATRILKKIVLDDPRNELLSSACPLNRIPMPLLTLPKRFSSPGLTTNRAVSAESPARGPMNLAETKVNATGA